ncbi:MAG: autotransporter domain-containing protein [Sphingobium sp.]|nr:autotransporter domain-containing protein [Sphingobium sp.]
MRTLRSTTFLTPLVLAILPQAAFAQLSISTATTTPVRTSTSGDITVTADGSITLASGSAITADSNNNVTNAGKLVMDGSANGSTAIDVQAGRTGTITNSGTITVLETFNAQNDDGNAIVDGPVASASGRAGIWVRGAHSGNIVNSGKISVDGLNSAGIRIDGTLSGSLTSSSDIVNIGDYSTGIKTGAVTGDVNVLGKVTVVGEGAVAVDIGGDVGGVLRLQNSIGQSTSYTNDAGAVMSLSRNDLRVGAPAVSVAGNVAGGIIVDTPPTLSTTNTDVDSDGILDANEGTGVITGNGNGPALRIGGASNTTVGAVAGNGHALVIKGSVLSNASYSNTDTVAIDIGGQGGAVTLTGGIQVTGKVQATTNDSMAGAILIHAGSVVPVLDNTGTIAAAIVSPGDGTLFGVRDLSGTLTTINTNGFITSGGSVDDLVNDAIDLSANTTGVTINQYSKDSETADQEKAINNQITGNIRTGSGNDLFTVSDGAVVGNTFFGAGNDILRLSGDATYSGKVDFGTGSLGTIELSNTSIFLGTAAFNDLPGTITLADTAKFGGNITGGSQLNIAVNSGTLGAIGTSNMVFNTLTVGANGTLLVAVDNTTKTARQFNVNTATFANGSKIGAVLTSLSGVEGTYLVLTASSQLTGTPTFSSEATGLPILFKGSVGVDTTARTVSLTIQRKTATELGFTANQAAAYPAILAAAPADSQLEAALLGAADTASLQSQFNQLLPEYAGGNFDLLTRGSRMATRHLANNNSMFDISNLGGWFEVIKWKGTKAASADAGFRTSGWGISAGLERVTDFGNVGISFDYLSGTNNGRREVTNHISANAYEFGLFWRKSVGPLYAFARGSYTKAEFTGDRLYTGAVSGSAFGREALSSHKGTMYSATGGVSYQLDVGDRIAFKPMALVDYYRLKEKGYTETNAGDAVNLIVAPRTSTLSTATTTLTGIYRLGQRTKDGIPLTFELEAGRRSRLGGTLGATTAHFKGGADFTVTPTAPEDSWLSELRVLSGGLDYTWTIAGGAERVGSRNLYTARVSLGVAF